MHLYINPDIRVMQDELITLRGHQGNEGWTYNFR
jgi:hypothetical protein